MTTVGVGVGAGVGVGVGGEADDGRSDAEDCNSTTICGGRPSPGEGYVSVECAGKSW